MRSSFAKLILTVCIAAALGGCATTASKSLPPIPATPPVFMGDAATLPVRPGYRAQVGDVLDIRLVQNPELNEQVTIRPDGMISTTIAEEVPAADRTPAEISAELRQRYKSDLKKTRLTVIVRSFAPNRIYVGGEVSSPGEFITVGPNLTISQAIARAGGVKLSGDRKRIFVIRRGSKDAPQAYAVDYMGIITGKTPEADARLAPYDVVYVPRTGVFEFYTFWNQFLQQFVPVSWGFSYSVNGNSSVSGR